MKELLENYFAAHRRELVESIGELVEIPSVRGEAENGKPYGDMPFAALTKALEIADGFGFKTKNYDGYVGSVDFNENETNLNIFAHLDVVAAGDGWHTEPYKMTEKDGVLYGRGVSDDKGPAMCALLAMKAVKDLKKNSPKKSGKYSKSWKKKIEKSRIGSNCVIYNEKYYLTHLLENGHANRDGGRTPAKPHIAPVNESIQKDFEEEIEKGIAKLS
mgnify:CR=1 FL=1